MRTKGRPREGDVKLRNGFYIEVCAKGLKKGVKIRSENQQAMELAAISYAGYKHVIVLGEYKDGEPFSVSSST